MPDRLVGHIQALYAQVEQWSASNLPCVWNDDLNRYRNGLGGDKVKWIVVADNPGTEESKDKRYLSCFGYSGRRIRNIFSDYAPNCNYWTSVLTLNKTVIYTPGTQELSTYRHSESFDDMQKYMADLTFALQRATDAYVWIMGINYWDIFSPFYKRMRNHYSQSSLSARLFISKHLSNGAFEQDVIAIDGKEKTGTELLQLGLVKCLKALPYTRKLLAAAPESLNVSPWR